MLAPWDGPAAIVFGDGRRVGALIDRNGLRPAAFAVNRDRLVAVRRRRAPCRFRRPRRSVAAASGRASCCWSSPDAGSILEDTEAKAWVLRHLPIHDQPRPLHEDPGPRPRRAIEARPPIDHAGRYLAGLDAERARLDIKTMALEATSRCGAWATTRRPRASGRLDRPVADHLRQAFAQVTNPPSTRSASGSSWTCGSSSAGGRRCSAARRAARGRLRLERPIVADLPGLARRATRSRTRSGRSTRPGRSTPGPRR